MAITITTMKRHLHVSPTPFDANSMAVALLKENKSAEAISCLRQGLKTMLNTKTNSIAEHTSCETSECAEQCPHSTHTSKRRRLMLVETSQADLYEQGGSITRTEDAPALKNTDMETSPDNLFVLFNRAIILSPSTRTARSSAYEATAESVFLYNIGLVYHREGAERGCSALLRRALSVYEVAWKSLSLHKNQAGSSHMIDLVRFALVNNMGHIHSHFFNKQGADGCRRYLHQNISAYASILSKDDFALFFMNVLMMKTELFQYAPAA
jgi:hypothetical protein